VSTHEIKAKSKNKKMKAIHQPLQMGITTSWK